MERQVLLTQQDGLVGADLSAAYAAVNGGVNMTGIVPRFKKKEDVEKMTKSILKHKIQTLTGKNVKKIEEEMKYKPKDPNEPSMDIDTMRRLASCLILLSNGEELPLPAPTGNGFSNGHSIPSSIHSSTHSSTHSSIQPIQEVEPELDMSVSGPGRQGRKRAPAPAPAPAPVNNRKVIETSQGPQEPKLAKKMSSRRSLGNILSSTILEKSPEAPTASLRRGRKSLAVIPNSQSLVEPTATAQSKSKKQSLNGSLVVTSCPNPAPSTREKEHLASLDETAEEQQSGTLLDNPTPVEPKVAKSMSSRRSLGNVLSATQPNKMKEILKKRESLGPSKAKSPVKAANKSPLKSRTDLIMAKAKEKAVVKRAPSPEARPEFLGRDKSKGFLVTGDPMELSFSKMSLCLPLSAGFPGAHLTMVHTPADWGPHEIFQITTQVKKLNKEAGLDNYVLLVGTGLTNVHMNMEALARHTKHVQFLTFNRADANQESAETGKLRETCSYFLVAYFFPGCSEETSKPPYKMVRDGFTTCFMTSSTVDLESQIMQCFSEPGEWLLDLAPGNRQLALAALEKGRCAIALHGEASPLEDLGNYIRTLSLDSDSTYREKDGLVLTLAS